MLGHSSTRPVDRGQASSLRVVCLEGSKQGLSFTGQPLSPKPQGPWVGGLSPFTSLLAYLGTLVLEFTTAGHETSFPA